MVMAGETTSGVLFVIAVPAELTHFVEFVISTLICPIDLSNEHVGLKLVTFRLVPAPPDDDALL